MPSRLKFGVRAALSEFGDLIVLAPFEPAESCCGDGISTVKSRFGSGYCLTTVALAAAVMVAVTEWGESPLEDGDMLSRPAQTARHRDGVLEGLRYPQVGETGARC